MHINMENYKIEDLKDEKTKMFLNGHSCAVEDFETALVNYLDECKHEDHSISTFEKLRKSILEEFFLYAKDYLACCYNQVLVGALDDQCCSD